MMSSGVVEVVAQVNNNRNGRDRNRWGFDESSLWERAKVHQPKGVGLILFCNQDCFFSLLGPERGRRRGRVMMLGPLV